jgi:hypothetical protein
MAILPPITGRIAPGITDRMPIQATNITIKSGATGGVTIPSATTGNTGVTDTPDIITGGTGNIAVIVTTADTVIIIEIDGPYRHEMAPGIYQFQELFLF